MWKGAKGLLLQDYLEDKIRIQELKRLPLRYRINGEDEEVKELENKIIDFLDMLEIKELKSLILMSLDIEI